jgi:hypothetical protein
MTMFFLVEVHQNSGGSYILSIYIGYILYSICMYSGHSRTRAYFGGSCVYSGGALPEIMQSSQGHWQTARNTGIHQLGHQHIRIIIRIKIRIDILSPSRKLSEVSVVSLPSHFTWSIHIFLFPPPNLPIQLLSLQRNKILLCPAPTNHRHNEWPKRKTRLIGTRETARRTDPPEPG